MYNPCVVTISLVVLLAQQTLLFLEMFTFFHQVTFVVVLFPLLIVVVLIWVENIDVIISEDIDCYHYHGMLPIMLATCSIPSIVLLMIKMDDFFEVGTAIAINSPEFSWAVIMIPVWAGFVVAPLVPFLLKIFDEWCCDND